MSDTNRWSSSTSVKSLTELPAVAPGAAVRPASSATISEIPIWRRMARMQFSLRAAEYLVTPACAVRDHIAKSIREQLILRTYRSESPAHIVRELPQIRAPTWEETGRAGASSGL